MRLEWIKEYDHNKRCDVLRFTGEILMPEMAELVFDAFDRALLDDCGMSQTAQDFLLAMEMVFRRYHEQINCTSNVELTGLRPRGATSDN